MRIFHRRPICILGSVLLILGILLFRLPSILLCILPLPILLSAILLRHRGFYFRLGAVLAALLCILVLLTAHLPPLLLSDSDPDDTWSFTVSEIGENGSVTATGVSRNGILLPFARLSVRCGLALSVGDRVTVKGARYSANTDYEADGIHGRLLDLSEPSVTHRPYLPSAWIARLKDAFSERLEAIGGETAGPLLRSLLLGEPGELPLGTSESFRRLGVSHILAISGMHLLVLASLLSRLLRLLRLPHALRTALSAAILILYALTVGATPSILRALVMALISLLSYYAERRTDSLSSLFLSGIVLSLLSPRVLLSLSFRLSFAATFGIIAAARVLRHLSLPASIPAWARRYLLLPLSGTAAALLFTLPISLPVFGRLSLLSLPANLLLAPLYELLLSLGLLALATGPLAPVRILVRAVAWLSLSLTEAIASIPSILLSASHPVTLFTCILLALTALALLILPSLGKRRTLLALSAPCLAFVLSLELFALPKSADCRITLLSDGKTGEAILLADGTGRGLIDLADGRTSLLGEIKHALGNEAVTELSFYLPTVYSEASQDRLASLCESYSVRLVLLPSAADAEERAVRDGMAEYLEAERIEYRILDADPSFTADGYTLSLRRRAGGVGMLTVTRHEGSLTYLTGAAASLLHYTDLPYSDTLILGSRDALASRLPPLNGEAETLILCSESYPSPVFDGGLLRQPSALNIPLCEH